MAEKCFCHLNGLKVKDSSALHGVDTTLSIEGMAPDAKTTGGHIRKIESYGIGKDIGAFCEDCNNAIYNGWYYISSNTKNKPSDLTVFDGAMFVATRWAKIFQIIYITISGEVTTLIRSTLDSGSNWSEWEWENPPMIYGVEYRTTERHNGKAVYVKSGIISIKNHDFAGFKNGDYSVDTGVPVNVKVIDFDATMSYKIDDPAVLCDKLPAFMNGELFMDCDFNSLNTVLFPEQYNTYWIDVKGKSGATVTADIYYTVKYVKE